jgi:hypothetical protein
MTKVAEAGREMGKIHAEEEEPQVRVGGDWPATRLGDPLALATSRPDDRRRPADRVRSTANPAYEIEGRPSTIDVPGQSRVRLDNRGQEGPNFRLAPGYSAPSRCLHLSASAVLLGSRAGRKSAGRRRVRPHCSIVSSLSAFSLFLLLPSRLRATRATLNHFDSTRRSTPSRCH